MCRSTLCRETMNVEAFHDSIKTHHKPSRPFVWKNHVARDPRSHKAKTKKTMTNPDPHLRVFRIQAVLLWISMCQYCKGNGVSVPMITRRDESRRQLLDDPTLTTLHQSRTSHHVHLHCGQPNPQRLRLLVDTGSAVTRFPCPVGF